MDVSQITGALRRRWYIALLGLIAAVGLGGLTYVKSQATYASDSTLFVTQSGFPWGRTVLDTDSATGTTTTTNPRRPLFADSARFADLAALYSRLARSDAVRLRVLAEGPIDGEVVTDLVSVSDSSNSSALPLVRIRALADTPEKAVDLAMRWSAAFRTYIAAQQRRGRVPARELVLLQQVETPAVRTVEVVKPRTATRPIAIGIAVLILTLAVVLLVDRARRGRQPKARRVGDPLAVPQDVESPGDALATAQGHPGRPGP